MRDEDGVSALKTTLWAHNIHPPLLADGGRIILSHVCICISRLFGPRAPCDTAACVFDVRTNSVLQFSAHVYMLELRRKNGREHPHVGMAHNKSSTNLPPQTVNYTRTQSWIVCCRHPAPGRNFPLSHDRSKYSRVANRFQFPFDFCACARAHPDLRGAV